MEDDLIKLKQIIDDASNVLIVQADNPDSDSLGSALALEQILMNLGKQTDLYCSVDMPGYIRYMDGWDRVSRDLPNKFDATIFVDVSTSSLLENLNKQSGAKWLSTKPAVAIDHHAVVENPIAYLSVTINDTASSSTGEAIYKLASQLNWQLNLATKEFISYAILGDTQGLTNDLANSQTYRIMADMIDDGVSRPVLEERRRELSKMPKSIFFYKADLIKRSEFFIDDRLALVLVPQAEINEFSPLYNPAPLVQYDLLTTIGVEIAIVIKQYDDGKYTAAIRCNQMAKIAAKLADQFGGGGHDLASGFKTYDYSDYNDLKRDVIDKVRELLNDETV